MRALEIQAGQLHLCQRPDPQVGDDQVLIEVKAAGVNRPDLMQCQGIYPPPPGASDIPGLEVAGLIRTVGSAVSHLKPGDKVCALVTGGGYADVCLASAKLCLPLPTGLDFIQAAALPETFFTVWSNLFDRGGLQAGHRVLIHGGSSGIGSCAIQLATAFGALAFTTAGSPAKCNFCRDLGASLSINYNTEDFVERILSVTQNRGVDIILDMIGGDYLSRNLKCLANEGRLLQIAIQGGAQAEVNLWRIMQKRLTLTGSTLRARDDDFKAAIARQLQRHIWPLLTDGAVKPIIYQTFPLENGAAAHALMQSSRHMGKIILTL